MRKISYGGFQKRKKKLCTAKTQINMAGFFVCEWWLNRRLFILLKILFFITPKQNSIKHMHKKIGIFVACFQDKVVCTNGERVENKSHKSFSLFKKYQMEIVN